MSASVKTETGTEGTFAVTNAAALRYNWMLKFSNPAMITMPLPPTALFGSFGGILAASGRYMISSLSFSTVVGIITGRSNTDGSGDTTSSVGDAVRTVYRRNRKEDGTNSASDVTRRQQKSVNHRGRPCFPMVFCIFLT